jgi:hypothetical protein
LKRAVIYVLLVGIMLIGTWCTFLSFELKDLREMILIQMEVQRTYQFKNDKRFKGIFKWIGEEITKERQKKILPRFQN